MSGLDTLSRRFDAARLPVCVATSPLMRRGQGLEDIVQLDIDRWRRRERFRVWPGHRTNRVEVVSTDSSLRQLVLLVEEQQRRFVMEVSPYVNVDASLVVRTVGRRRWVERFTRPSKRHLLCGMDEGHLFIAELPQRVTSVRDAHAALRPPQLALFERQAEGRTLRQGEWFFVPLAPGAEPRPDATNLPPLLKRRTGIAQAAHLRRTGRPHVADEVLVVPGGSAPAPSIFVRGAVRHPEHRTVVLLRWHRVLQNAEPAAEVPGLLWVD